jgi:hypothetical protein
MLTPYCYIIVRKDIPLCDQMVQSNHASLEAGRNFSHPPGTHICLLQIKNEKQLLNLDDKLARKGINKTIFYEPDWKFPGFTAIATEALYGSERKIFKDLNLWIDV